MFQPTSHQLVIEKAKLVVFGEVIFIVVLISICRLVCYLLDFYLHIIEQNNYIINPYACAKNQVLGNYCSKLWVQNATSAYML